MAGRALFAALIPLAWACAFPVGMAHAQAAAFADGRTDRLAYELWLGTLGGLERAGAEYWAGQRSRPEPGDCAGPGTPRDQPWTNGCREAQRRLYPSDVRRRHEPEYRQGWNSVTAAETAGPASASPAGVKPSPAAPWRPDPLLERDANAACGPYEFMIPGSNYYDARAVEACRRRRDEARDIIARQARGDGP